MTKDIDLDALHRELLESLQGIVEADWRKWEELASPEEFVRWAKSRANHMIARIREMEGDTGKSAEAGTVSDLAHEIWAAAQLTPGEGIEDGVDRIETVLMREHIADAGKTMDALRWTAAALQAQRREQDIVSIDGDSKTVGQILDEADAALGIAGLAAPGGDTPQASPQADAKSPHAEGGKEGGIYEHINVARKAGLFQQHQGRHQGRGIPPRYALLDKALGWPRLRSDHRDAWLSKGW